MAAQPSLDMGNGGAGSGSGERRPHRAGGVALDDDQIWWAAKMRLQRFCDSRYMSIRIAFAGDVNALGGKATEPEFLRVEVRMLPGEKKPRQDTAIFERVRDRCQFDCFGPGANDQPDVGETQTSP